MCLAYRRSCVIACTLGSTLLTGCGLKGVNYPGTATSLVLSANTAPQGTNILFSAMVSPAAGDGTVSFFDGGTMIGSGGVVAGQASFSTASLAVGNHSVTAEFNGTYTDAPSTSSPVPLDITAVPQAPTTTTLTASTTSLTLGCPLSLTATVSPPMPGTVNLYDGGTLVDALLPLDPSGVATVNGTVYTPGLHNFTATYEGAIGRAPSTSNTVGVTVSAGPPVPTSITLSIEPSAHLGDLETLTITILPLGAQGSLTVYITNSTTKGPQILVGSSGGSLIPLVRGVSVSKGLSASGSQPPATGCGGTGVGQTDTITSQFPLGPNYFAATFTGETPFESSQSSVVTLMVNP